MPALEPTLPEVIVSFSKSSFLGSGEWKVYSMIPFFQRQIFVGGQSLEQRDRSPDIQLMLSIWAIA